MPVGMPDKLKPLNNGEYALMDAEDVEMPNGSRLPDCLPVCLTLDEYNELVKSGGINANTPYLIRKDDDEGG